MLISCGLISSWRRQELGLHCLRELPHRTHGPKIWRINYFKQCLSYVDSIIQHCFPVELWIANITMPTSYGESTWGRISTVSWLQCVLLAGTLQDKFLNKDSQSCEEVLVKTCLCLQQAIVTHRFFSMWNPTEIRILAWLIMGKWVIDTPRPCYVMVAGMVTKDKNK